MFSEILYRKGKMKMDLIGKALSPPLSRSMLGLDSVPYLFFNKKSLPNE